MIIRDFNELKIGEDVTIFGWVHSLRKHGKMAFLDLRNRSGIVQCVLKGEDAKRHLPEESVVKITGIVKERVKKSEKMFGDIEIDVKNIEVLSLSKPLPLDIKNPEIIKNTKEETRLKWRYLDLRRPEMLNAITFRAKVMKAFREFLDEHGFIEVETPYFAKSTPEGSRDFVVPSRIHTGKFYALAQSPQLYKQILMVAGFEKYYQFARCFRDEDPRADRQPEFTQVDIEMSFVDREDVLNIVEELTKYVVEKTTGVKLPKFPRITWREAMEIYGTDKPDLRIEEKIETVEDVKFIQTSFKPKDEQLKELEKLGVKYYYKGKGVDEAFEKIKSRIKEDFVVYARFDENTWEDVSKLLGKVRNLIGKWKGLSKDYKFLWVVDFPLFEINEEGKIVSSHHPFTMVKDPKMLDEPLKATSLAYDLVLNGSEVAGGSIRIHREDVQKKIFEILNLPDEEIEKRYGFLLRAFEYGVPPHGGIAFGFDRFVAKLLFKENIREVIAFPKTADWREPMTDTPSDLPKEYIDEIIKPMVEELRRRKII